LEVDNPKIPETFGDLLPGEIFEATIASKAWLCIKTENVDFNVVSLEDGETYYLNDTHIVKPVRAKVVKYGEVE
jgi:hypothetical protein